MRSYAVNISALVYSLGLVLGFELGVIAAANAFFAGILLVAMFTGYQLLEREGMPFLSAVRDIATRPDTYPRSTAYGAYVVSLALGFLVVSHTALTALTA